METETSSYVPTICPEVAEISTWGYLSSMRGTSHTSIRRNNTAVDQHSNRNVSDLCAISVGNMAIHMTDGLSLSARYIAMPHLPRDHTTQPARQNLAATLQQEAVFGIVVCQRWRRWAATQLFAVTDWPFRRKTSFLLTRTASLLLHGCMDGMHNETKERRNKYSIRTGIQYGNKKYRSRKGGPGWISYMRMGEVYINFSTVQWLHNLLFSCKSQPAFLIARFLISCPVLYTSIPYSVRVLVLYKYPVNCTIQNITKEYNK